MHAIDPIPSINLKATLLPSPAFHPHLSLSFQTPNASTCRLRIQLMLPDWLFADPDELTDIWGPSVSMAAVEDSSLVAWSIAPSVVDIERPFRSGASQHVLELLSKHDIEIPLHARYLPPAAQPSGKLRLFDLQDDVLGTSELRAKLICEGLQPDELLQIPVRPLEIALPTGQSVHKPLVTFGTVIVVWSCWAWLAYKLYISRRPNVSSRKAQ